MTLESFKWYTFSSFDLIAENQKAENCGQKVYKVIKNMAETFIRQIKKDDLNKGKLVNNNLFSVFSQDYYKSIMKMKKAAIRPSGPK